MSDSEDGFFGRKKQRQPLIDSEDDNDEKPSHNDDSTSQSPSRTSEFHVTTGADAEPISSSLNGPKTDRLSLVDHSHCVSDETSISQSPNQVRSQCSQTGRNSQSSISQSSSVSSANRKSCLHSDSSDSDSASTIVSNRSSSQRSTKRLSPGPRSSSQSNNTITNRNLNTKSSEASSDSDSFSEAVKVRDSDKNLINTKSDVDSASCSEDEIKTRDTSSSNKNLDSNSFATRLESDFCSEADGKVHDTSVNSIDNDSLSKEKSDISDSEEIAKPKARKYKLLSDDDLSEDDGHPVEHVDIESDGGNLNVTERLKLKKDERKKKLQMLNQLKRKEIKEKSGDVSSDLEDENRGMIDTTKDRHNDNSGVSSDNSATSDSESEKAKSKTKTNRKSLPQRKSKKIDPKLEIKSKTQKMIRENRISLPYHQPKKRSLDEFLARRKNSPSIPLKATNDVLHVVSEHLRKREKEVEVFYKSESDHSDDGGENQSTVDETANNPTDELQNQENLLENSTIPVNNATSLDKDDLATELRNEVEITEKSESTDDVPIDGNSCDQDPSSDTEMIKADCESSKMDYEASTEKGENFFDDQLMKVDHLVTGNEAVSGITNTDLVNPVDPMTESRSSPSPQEINFTETSKGVEENPEVHSISELPETETSPQQNSIGCGEAVSKNLEHPVEENETEENSSSGPKKLEEKNTEPPDTDDFDLMIQDSSTSKQSVQNDTEPPDTDDFDLMIQDSCNSTEESKNDSEMIAPEPATVLRSKKLELLSRLKIPLRSDIKLQASPDMVIELETPAFTESEFGVYELKKKFAFHSSMRIKPIRKSSTKLSILRTETDSQGEIIDVVKEIIDIDCGDVKEDEEKEKFSTPGAKHLNFKEHMLKSLIEKKQAKWREYQEEKRKFYGTQSSDEEDFDEEFSEKPNFEPYHPEDELDDDELEEDDVEIKEKKKERNDFVDDEAEVSSDEDENPKESEDEESEKEIEAEETGVEGDHESADDEAEVEADDKDEDSDAEMLSTKETTELSKPPAEVFKKPLPSQVFPIFKYNTTGTDLENKVLGFESIFEEKRKSREDVTCSQLFEICSGKFATQVERLNSSDPSDSEFFTDSQHGEDSQNINLSLQDTNDGFHASDAHISENRSLLFLSDESDTEELFARKKKLMRLDDSDDEKDTPAPVDDAKSDEVENEDIDDAVEDAVDDADEPIDEEDADEVDALDDDDELAYNSEEEIITKQKAAEFLENEAELSESEWGSEDENEQNLDELEKEAGDDDVLDEDELKKELGKIHMRQLLDDDQHDVRMLKEMLLEDGDLHSDGKRQRKFQWTNLDDNGFFSKMANDSDEEVLNEEDEEEMDANWRKIRHEREMFISQQEKREDLLEEAEDEADSLPLPKTNSNDVPAKVSKPSVVTNNNISSPDLKLPFKARSKCGSFLTRSKMLLDRLAVTVGECKENVTGKAKNHRNFVFAAVSPPKELPNVPETKTEKRKISSKSVMARKKLKLASTNERGLLAQLALSE